MTRKELEDWIEEESKKWGFRFSVVEDNEGKTWYTLTGNNYGNCLSDDLWGIVQYLKGYNSGWCHATHQERMVREESFLTFDMAHETMKLRRHTEP